MLYRRLSWRKKLRELGCDVPDLQEVKQKPLRPKEVLFDENRARALFDEGKSDLDCAEMLGISVTAFATWRKKNGLMRARGGAAQRKPRTASRTKPCKAQPPTPPEAETPEPAPETAGSGSQAPLAVPAKHTSAAALGRVLLDLAERYPGLMLTVNGAGVRSVCLNVRVMMGEDKLLYRFYHPNNGKGYLLDPMSVLHYKGYTEDGIHGISVLHHARNTLEAAAAREAYDKAVYENGGSPAGTLETDSDLHGYAKGTDGQPLKREDGSYVTKKDVIRGEWERVHSGAANAFRVAVLDLGLSYKPIAVNNRDAQFVESKAVSIEDIARFIGIPLNKLFTGKQSYNSNEANSLDVLTDTLQPIITQYEQEDKWKLLPTDETADGLYIRRNMMVTLRADTASRGNWFKTMREIGAYSVNDILHKEGEPSVPGGDKRLYSKNFDDLENLGKTPAVPQAGGAT